jgi:hypothetical protein
MHDRGHNVRRLLQSSLDEEGPARPLSPDRVAAIVQAICLDAERALPPRPAHRRRWLTIATLAACGTAFAGTVAWMQRHLPVPAPAAPAAGMRPVPPPAVMTPAAPAAFIDSSSDSIAHHRPATVPRRSAEAKRPALAVAERRSVPEAPGARSLRAQAQAANDALARANRLRAGRRWAEAADAYATVMARGDARSRYVAALARATLLLDRLHQPSQALRLYQLALSLDPAGSLLDEALYGVAASARALGDGPTERAALERLLASRPSSPLGPSASRRLSELGRR